MNIHPDNLTANKIRHILKKIPRNSLASFQIIISCYCLVYAGDAGGPEIKDTYPQALTIENATELAIKVNLDLFAARYSISIAQADELSAGLWNNPSIQIDTGSQPFGKNWNQTTAGGPRQYDLTLSYPLDLSGKRAASVKSARAARQGAEASFQDSIRQKVLQVRLAYIDLMLADYQLTLSGENEKSMNRLVTMIENRIGNKGRQPLLQNRARLGLAQARNDVRQRETALRNAKTALAILLNRPPVDTSVDASSRLRDFKINSLPPPAELESQAITYRPDLEALRLAMNKADLDIDLAHAQIWNDIELSWGVSRIGPVSANPNDPGSSSQPGAYSWNAGVTIPIPVLNRNQGNINRAVFIREQTEKQFQSLRLSVRQEIAACCEQIRLNEMLIRDYENTQLANATSVRNIQQTLFGAGSSSILDYFDSVNAYHSTLSSYYDTVAEYRRGIAKLNAAVGRDILR